MSPLLQFSAGYTESFEQPEGPARAGEHAAQVEMAVPAGESGGWASFR